MKLFLKPLWLTKLFNYEYWTWWVFFLPLAPYWFYLALRNRSLTYFTAVNPCIPDGGVFGESKQDILKRIDSHYLPKSLFISKGDSWAWVESQLRTAGIEYPFIAKPDVGGRGFRVYKFSDSDSFKSYLNTSPYDVIAQEFIEYEVELGVMYARMPDSSKGIITSITQKEFLTVTGDGFHTVGELLLQNVRARFSMEELRVRVREYWDVILPDGERRMVQPIGNHCLGTKFLDVNFKNTPQLQGIFDQISLPIDGFYYGRFDLKVPSWEDLYAGQNIKILELNGATSEPGHIYDPDYRLWQAYRDVMQHMRIVADISAANMQRGIRPTSLRKILQTARAFFAVSGQM